jgi:acetyl/propionyl-CoA carboxylase alpha subunit
VTRFRKLLIANRGEIARRVIRSARGMDLATVAVYSEPDRDEPHAREADEAVALGGASAAESYLRIEALLEAARRSGADALHPGYGFLAESAELSRRCAEVGLVFVGPPAEVIAAMGSKIEARRRMEKAGLPVLPSAPCAGPHDLERALRELGLPLLVKASAGGGGKAMRLVREPGALAAAVEAGRREAAAAFGDDTLFFERYLEAPRHVEVQIFGDRHGRVIELGERECSIQRRHQKILEESPSPGLEPDTRRALREAALAAGRALGYLGAGTVEFLLDERGEFWFLEVNTRLQVEHPVTECRTGLDLVRLQLEVAEGAHLPDPRDLPAARGHAIEARLYAEDPERDFLPCTGIVHRFEVPADAGVRVDSGVESGSRVGIHYDPLLAKLVAHAETREEAARRLADALARMRLHGPRTNRDLLVRLLRHPEFLAGRTDTHFLERHPPAALGAPLADAAATRLHAAAAALAAQAGRRAAARVLPGVPSGWRNNPSALQSVVFESRHGPLAVGYRFAREGLRLEVEGERLPARLGRLTPEAVELEVEGVRRLYRVERVGALHYVDSPLGASELRELERFPRAEAAPEAGSLAAPMPGVVRKVCVRVGERVAAGQLLVVLEAMKMEHPVAAACAGRVAALRASEGEQVDAGHVLVVIEPEEEGQSRST